MGPSPINTNTWFPHFCPIRIIAQCPDTLTRVHWAQIPDSDISAWLELLHSVQTHGSEYNWFKYPNYTFWHPQNCCSVSGNIGPGPIGSNTRFRHFCQIRIVVQCPETLAQVQSVQIPDSDISARLELLHSVRTHWPESIWFKYLIPTFLPD